MAVAISNMKIVQLLLDHGANIAAVDEWGRTALHYAAENHSVDVIEFVLKQGFDIESRDRDDHSPIHHAVALGSPEGCELLLRSGAMINRKSGQTGLSPLSCLLANMSISSMPRGVSVVRILLEYGAQVSDRVGGHSILEIAAGQHVGQRIRNALLGHMARMKYFNTEISEYDQKTIETKECYRGYYERCLQELESMKEAKFYSNVSIFNILMKSQKVISRIR